MAVAALDLNEGRRHSRPTAVTAPFGFPVRFRITGVLRVAIALLVIGNLGRVPLFAASVKSVPFLFNDLVVVVIVSTFLLATLRNRSLILDGPAAIAILFAAVGGLSALLAVPRYGLTGLEFGVSIAYLLRWIAYFGIYLTVINFVRREDVDSLWRTLEGTILVFGAFGIVQSLFLPGFAQIVFPDQNWDVQGHRLVSTFLDPNFAGAFLFCGLLVLLARMSFGVPTPVWKPLLLFAGFILTISRSSLLGLLAGGIIILLVRGHSRRLLGFSIVLALLVLPFLPLIIDFAMSFGRFSMEGSASARLVTWMRAITVFLDNPVIGIGFNTYLFVQESYGWEVMYAADSATDGGLLFIAVLTGLVGVSLYLAMISLVLKRCWRLWSDSSLDPSERGLGLGIAAFTVGLVVHSIFLNSLLYTFLMEALWILWGLSYLLAHRTQPPGGHRGSPGPSRGWVSVAGTP